MKLTQELARLNLLLELVSECTALADVPGILRLLAGRLRWVLEFDACTFTWSGGTAPRHWLLSAGDEAFQPVPAQSLPPAHTGLLEAIEKTGAPAYHGTPITAVGFPLCGLERQLGALVVARTTPFTHRDLRLLHHVCASLGAVLGRVAQHEALLRQHEAATLERAAREHAEAASLSKDRFIAMLGHELRNPLAPIRAAVPLLRRHASEDQAVLVDIVDRQSQHLHRLVEDLLDVSRITSGKVELKRRPLDVSAVVAKALEMARPGLAKKGQHLVTRLPPAPLKVDADETRLVQVLANLLNNAVTYSPAGAHIEVSCRQEGDLAVVSVADDGAGFEPQALRQMFEPFVQGTDRPDRPPGGLGLGLAVARSLVELHGGTIHGTSEGPGRGSCFTVHLPALDSADMGAPAQEVTSSADAVPPMRILLVDDNADAADTLAALLQCYGHEVTVAYDPDQALTVAAAFRPDLAVLDIGLPKMDGHELARRLRATEHGSGLMLVALSGYGQESARRKSLESGFAAHMLKPADPQALNELLARLSARRNGRNRAPRAVQ